MKLGSLIRHKSILFSISAILLWLGLPAPPALGASAQWAANGVQVSSNTGGKSEMQMCPDGGGGAYFVWVDVQDPNFGVCYVHRLAADGSPAAGWTSGPLAVSTADPATNGHFVPQIMPDGAGGCFIVYQQATGASIIAEGDGNDIYMQRINGNRTRAWAAAGVAVCTAAYAQITPQLCSDDAGGAIVVWADRRNTDESDNGEIFAQRLNSGGAAQWVANGVMVCGEPYAQLMPRVARDGSGGAYVAWYDLRGPQVGDIYASRLTSAGAIASGWNNTSGVAVCTASLEQTNPKVCYDNEGGCYVAWIDARSVVQGIDVYLTRLTSSGSTATGWTAGGDAVGDTGGPQTMLQIMPDGSGGVYATWSGGPDADNDVYLQRLDANGAVHAGWPDPSGVKCTDADYAQNDPRMCSDGQGGVYLAWDDYRDNGNYTQVYAQRVTASGQLGSGWPQDGYPVCTASGDAEQARVAAGASQGLFVGWLDYRNDPVDKNDAEVWAQRIDGGAGVANGGASSLLLLDD